MGDLRLVTAGMVGRSHGLDGSFTVELPGHSLEPGTLVWIAGVQRRIERRDGTDDRPLVRIEGIGDQKAVRALRGERLLVEDTLAADEWLAEDLIGCDVEGLGEVRRIVGGPSCDVLELDGGQLVPLVSDAIVAVDLEARSIQVDRRFLRLDEDTK